MTWNTHHRRAAVLRAVTAAADTRLDGVLPMDLEGVTQTFADELDLLAALQLRWHTRLAGQVERALMTHPADPEAAVVDAWRETAVELPGVRAVLDHYAAAPLDGAMAHATAVAATKEHQMLAAMAGLAPEPDADAARVGADLAARARAERLPRRRADGLTNRGLLDRLKAVVAA